MNYKVMAKIDFNDKDNGDIKREANKSIWEITDKERVDCLISKGAIEILEDENKIERKRKKTRKIFEDDDFMI